MLTEFFSTIELMIVFSCVSGIFRKIPQKKHWFWLSACPANKISRETRTNTEFSIKHTSRTYFARTFFFIRNLLKSSEIYPKPSFVQKFGKKKYLSVCLPLIQSRNQRNKKIKQIDSIFSFNKIPFFPLTSHKNLQFVKKNP